MAEKSIELLQNFLDKAGRLSQAELIYEFGKTLKNLRPNEVERIAKEIQMWLTVGGKRGAVFPELEKQVGAELVEEGARYIFEINDKHFVDSLKKYSELLNEGVGEEDEDYPKKVKERIEAQKKAWEEFRKALFIFAVENGQKDKAHLLKSWIEEEEIPAPNSTEKLRQPLISKKEANKLYTLMLSTERQKRQAEIFTEKEFKLYKEARLRMHTLSYYALRSVLGREVFKSFEECIRRSSQVSGGDGFKHCVERHFDAKISEYKADMRRSLQELQTPMGWVFGFVKIAEFIWASGKKNALMYSKGKLLFPPEKVLKFYKQLSEPGLSEARAKYVFYKGLSQTYGGVKVSDGQGFLRGLISDAIQKRLEKTAKEWEKSLKVEAKVGLKEYQLKREEIKTLLEKFEDGKINLEVLISGLEKIGRDTKVLKSQIELIRDKLLSKFKEEKGELTIGGNSLKLSKSFKLIKTDSGLVAINEQYLKDRGVDIESFVEEIKDKEILPEKMDNLNAYSKTLFAHIVEGKKEMENPISQAKKVVAEKTKTITRSLKR